MYGRFEEIVAARTPNSGSDDLIAQIGSDILGPVFHRWLIGLDQYASYFGGGDGRLLFCARAGVRIKRLFDLYRERRGRSVAQGESLFWTSRISICKGVFARVPNESLRHIVREYGGAKLGAVVEGVLRHQPDRLAAAGLTTAECDLPAEDFAAWLDGSTPAADDLRAYLLTCGADLDTYIDSVLEGASQAILVDSGWGGSMQALLSRAYPEREWYGVYVGRSLGPHHDPLVIPRAIGLLFEDQEYDPLHPASAITQCRHLIETILEPNAPSIEEVPNGRFAETADAQISANMSERVDPAIDPLFLAVEAYVARHANMSLSEAFRRYDKAIRQLERLLVAPSRAEAQALVLKDRSADFGKLDLVPVLLTDVPDSTPLGRRFSTSLWPQGQAALDHAPAIARSLQAALTGASKPVAYFDPQVAHRSNRQDRTLLREEREPTVAIITRTKDRPLMLARAAASVAAQHFGSYHWVVVNDGGNEAAVRDVIANCAVDPRRITLVSNDRSVGMEAASNLGIGATESDLIVIHDDDDSWDPAFLRRTADFLSSGVGGHYGGVVTHTMRVFEEILGDTIVELKREPYCEPYAKIYLAEMARQNLFPPIALLYRRSCWDRIGGYRESLPVLGDWLFNLKFLLADDIAVLPEALAFYHHRAPDSIIGSYGNSLSTALSKHEEFDPLVRNIFMREHGHSPAALAVLTGYPSAVPTESQQTMGLRSELRHFTETADRRWCIATVNHFIAQRLALQDPKIGLGDMLAGECSWERICERLLLFGLAPSPPPDFDESYYLELYPDVCDAVASRRCANGFTHYVLSGRAEARLRPGA